MPLVRVLSALPPTGERIARVVGNFTRHGVNHEVRFHR